MRLTLRRALRPLVALIALNSAEARAVEPCPTQPAGEGELPVTRAEVQELTRRAFEGYRLRDNRVVREARCDVERAMPRLVEPLGAADVSRVHLVYALDVSISGGSPEEVTAYLVAARAADPIPDDLLPALSEEGDDLLILYNELQAPGSGLLQAYAEPAEPLAPAWRGQVRVNGQDQDGQQNGPYFVQVIGEGAQPKLTVYHDDPQDRLQYTRLRPVQAGLIGGTAALGLASLGLGAVFSGRAEDWEVPRGSAQAGSALQADLDQWQQEQDRNTSLNHVFLGTACGLGVVTLGLGVWVVATF